MENSLEYAYNKAVDNEYRVNRLYTCYAGFFPDHGPVPIFWQLMADDEVSHRNRLRERLVLLDQHRRQIPVKEQVLDDLGKTADLLRYAEKYPIRNLDDAYEIAHQIETSEFNSTYRLLSACVVPDARHMVKIEAEVTRHLERIFFFGITYDQPARRSYPVPGLTGSVPRIPEPKPDTIPVSIPAHEKELGNAV